MVNSQLIFLNKKCAKWFHVRGQVSTFVMSSPEPPLCIEVDDHLRQGLFGSPNTHLHGAVFLGNAMKKMQAATGLGHFSFIA